MSLKCGPSLGWVLERQSHVNSYPTTWSRHAVRAGAGLFLWEGTLGRRANDRFCLGGSGRPLQRQPFSRGLKEESEFSRPRRVGRARQEVGTVWALFCCASVPLHVLVSAWDVLVSPCFLRSVLPFLLIMTQASTLFRLSLIL